MTGLKLGGVENDRVYVTSGLSVGEWCADHGFRARGILPHGSTLARVADRRIGDELFGRLTGFIATTNVWPLGGDRRPLGSISRLRRVQNLDFLKLLVDAAAVRTGEATGGNVVEATSPSTRG